MDDDLAPMSTWLPYFADAVGASPKNAPALLARLAAGSFGVAYMTRLRGADNAAPGSASTGDPATAAGATGSGSWATPTADPVAATRRSVAAALVVGHGPRHRALRSRTGAGSGVRVASSASMSSSWVWTLRFSAANRLVPSSVSSKVQSS